MSRSYLYHADDQTQAAFGNRVAKKNRLTKAPVAETGTAFDTPPRTISLAFAALPLAGVEANVGNEFLGTVEAPDVSNDGQQGKSADNAHAEDFHTAHHRWIRRHFIGDPLQAAETSQPGGENPPLAA